MSSYSLRQVQGGGRDRIEVQGQQGEADPAGGHRTAAPPGRLLAGAIRPRVRGQGEKELGPSTGRCSSCSNAVG